MVKEPWRRLAAFTRGYLLFVDVNRQNTVRRSLISWLTDFLSSRMNCLCIYVCLYVFVGVTSFISDDYRWFSAATWEGLTE